MRKMRKALSFVLVVALVLGSFSMVFGAGTTSSGPAALSDVKGLVGEDQINVCQNLGIIEGFPDGTFQPNELVNRAQFAAIITRALGIPESALAGYSTVNFTDTSGYGWAIPYLAFCQSKGIMIGYGDGTARPGNTITVNEAMTMILRTLGYIDNSSELVGKWPANFVTKAKALRLYDDLSNEVYMDRQNAAIAMYNALVVQLVSVNTDGKTDPLWVKGTNYTDANGVFQGVPLNLANTGLDCETTPFQVLDPSWYGSTLINISDKLGAYGTTFVNRDGYLVAFSTTVEGSTLLTGYIDGKNFIGLDDGKKYTIANDALNPYGYDGANKTPWENDVLGFVNADSVDLPDATEVVDSDGTPIADWNNYEYIQAFAQLSTTDKGNACDDDEVTLSAKVSGLTIRAIYAIVGWSVNDDDMVSQAEINEIDSDQSLLSGDFVLDDDQNIDMRQFSLVGVDNLDEISPDDVVYIYKDSADKIRKLAVGQDVVEGTIDESSSDEFVIEGESYSYADDIMYNLVNATADSEVSGEAGSDAVVNLDAYGYAYNVDLTGGGPGLFGVITAVDGTSTVDLTKIRAYTSDDSDEVFSLVKDNKLDMYNTGTIGSATKKASHNPSTAASETRNFITDRENEFSGYLFGLKLNSAGNITTLEPAVNSGTVIVRSSTILVDTGKGTVTIDKNAPVFSWDSGTVTTPKDDYSVGVVGDIDIQKIRNDYPSGVDAQYVLNYKCDKVIALLLMADVAGGTSDDVYGVVNSFTNIKVGGDKANRLYTLVDGVKATLDTTDDFSNSTELNDLDVVQLFVLTKNSEGKVKAVATITSGDRYVTGNALAANKTPGDTANSAVKLDGGGKIPVQSDVVVYKADTSKSPIEYSKVSGIGSIKAGSRVWAYDTKADKDLDGIATVVIYVEP